MEIISEKIIDKYAEELSRVMHENIMLKAALDELKNQNSELNQIINTTQHNSKSSFNLDNNERKDRLDELEELDKRNQKKIKKK